MSHLEECLYNLLQGETPDHAHRLMADLKPFFQRSYRGEYPLKQASNELRGEALITLASLFPEKGVKKVMLISRFSLLENPELMCGEIGDGETIQNICQNKFRHDFHHRYEYLRRNQLESELKKLIYDSFRFEPERSLEDIVWSSLWISISHYIGLTIVGNTEMADQMKCLIDFQFKAIFLNERKSELGTWFVLCQ